MERGVLYAIVLCLLIFPAVFALSPLVDTKILEELGKNDTVEAIIILNEDPGIIENSAQLEGKNTARLSEAERKKMIYTLHQQRLMEDPRYEQKKNEWDLRKMQLEGEKEMFKDKVLVKRTLSSSNALSVELSRDSLAIVQNDARIKSVILNKKLNFVLDTSTTLINATKTWKQELQGMNLTGSGETVCVIDSGIAYNHSAFGSCTRAQFVAGTCRKVIGGEDLKNDDNDPYDDQGHGTHVSGIIASENSTYRGVAPGAKLVAMKVCDNSGGGNCEIADIITAMEWCTANRTRFNISVISLSLGTTDLFWTHCDQNASEVLLKNAVDAAVAQNISVVAASGNSGSFSAIVSPACLFNATAVGSSTDGDALSSFSNRNNITDLVAPGSTITSTVPSDGCILCDSSGFATLSGTSMATPHVSGMFALMRQWYRLEKGQVPLPSSIQNILNDTGRQISDSGASNLMFSRPNVLAAIESVDNRSPVLNVTFPANNSIRNPSTFFVLINASESLNNATLEINNTNFTMRGDSQFWNVSPLLVNGSYTFKIYGNDTFGNANDSSLYTIFIDSVPPIFADYSVNNSNPRYNETLQLNVTWNDTVGLSYYILTRNDSGIFSNATAQVISGASISLSINITVNATKNNTVGLIVYVNDSANNFNQTTVISVLVANTNPQANNVLLASNDALNRTNATVSVTFSMNDADNDTLRGNLTRWYRDGVEVVSLRNVTSISPENTTKGEQWNASVAVYDGSNYSVFVNATIVIKNSAPIATSSSYSITLNETSIANITVNATDLDNDAINLSINDSRFRRNGTQFLWDTNVSSSGSYALNVTANDTQDASSIIISIAVVDARDIDNDGNPDFNDTDDDNDNIADAVDYLTGNRSSVNTSFFINITINSTSNYSVLFNGSLPVNISNGSNTLFEFNFTFNESSTLDLGSLTVNRTTNGSSAMSIRGVNVSVIGQTKIAYLEKVNSTVDAVCIRDAEASFESISSGCRGSNEVLVSCDNQASNGFTCLDIGNAYKVSGLRNSAIKEMCLDVDGDSYGTGCAAGSDCDDTDNSKTTTCSSGSGGSGGSGGGGGGGGAAGTQTVASPGDKVQYIPQMIAGQPYVIRVHSTTLPIDSIELTSQKNLSKVTLSIRDLKNKTATFGIIPYAYYDVQLTNANIEDVEESLVYYIINETWFEANGLGSEAFLYSLPEYELTQTLIYDGRGNGKLQFFGSLKTGSVLLGAPEPVRTEELIIIKQEDVEANENNSDTNVPSSILDVKPAREKTSLAIYVLASMIAISIGIAACFGAMIVRRRVKLKQHMRGHHQHPHNLHAAPHTGHAHQPSHESHHSQHKQK